MKPEVQRTKALSSLRSDVLSTNEDAQLEVSEAGKYRCLVSNTVNAVNSTLTAYSEVSIASSTPDPTVTFSVTLPSVEGAALSPLAGTYSVEAGGSFSFSLTLDTDYDQSTPMVKVGDKLIEPTSDGKYEIKNINSDITISNYRDRKKHHRRQCGGRIQCLENLGIKRGIAYPVRSCEYGLYNDIRRSIV